MKNWFKKITATVVLALVLVMAQGVDALAAVSYSITASYSNPKESGTATAEYDTGKVSVSDNNVSGKQLTQYDVAAASSETDNEICLGIDQYGTFWVIWREQSIWWYNSAICGKKAVLQQWKGLSNNQEIRATRLCYKTESGSMQYVGFARANYYTSGKDLEDYPLPSWKELYKVYWEEEYVEETPTPDKTETPATEAPKTETPATEVPKTEAPAQVQTVPPMPTTPETQEPAPQAETQAPAPTAPAVIWTLSPQETFVPVVTKNPDGGSNIPNLPAMPTFPPATVNPATPAPNEIQIDWNNKTTWTKAFWIEAYMNGLVEWEELKTVWYEKGWAVQTQNLNHSVTYYYYDDNGRLVAEETVEIQQGSESGKESGSGQEYDQGAANFQVNLIVSGGAIGQAESTGSADIKVGEDIISGGNGGSASKKAKTYWTRKMFDGSKGRVKLVKHKAGWSGVVCEVPFNKKTGKAIFNGKTYKKTKAIHYAGGKKRHNIVRLVKAGKYSNGRARYRIQIIQRAKGEGGHKWKNRYLKGYFTGVTLNPNNLAIRANRISGRSVGLKNIKAKKIR